MRHGRRERRAEARPVRELRHVLEHLARVVQPRGQAPDDTQGVIGGRPPADEDAQNEENRDRQKRGWGGGWVGGSRILDKKAGLDSGEGPTGGCAAWLTHTPAYRLDHEPIGSRRRSIMPRDSAIGELASAAPGETHHGALGL